MSSNTSKQESRQSNVEEKAQEPLQDRDEEMENGGEVRVIDKRRYTLDDEFIDVDENIDPVDSADVASEKPAEGPTEIEQLQTKLKEIDEKRAEAERQVREFTERFRQAQAQLKTETEEQRARMQRTFEQKLEAARGSILESLLDALDNLKRATAAAEKSEKRDADFEALLGGVRATANLFESKMQSLGLSSVESLGQQFDPEIHEAVEIVPVSPEQDNRVIEEFQTGYKFGDRLLRPARVRVGRASD
ncbi:MAG: nucleotide exchange factor GrpE [Acidobacteria bacterium]|nr:nucleotide exchange factor GrpE [Acidobacteriota bacterium]